ncbi:unnamed protein product [Closterium sp. NIES-53]
MHQTLLWHHHLGHPSLPRLCGMHSPLLVYGLPRSLPSLPRSLAPPCLPCVKGRQLAAPHSSYHSSSADTPHGHSKAGVRGVLIRWIRAARLQLCARFRQDLPVLRLHSDRGGESCSHLLEDFCGAEGIVTSYTLPASPQQNGIAERRIGLGDPDALDIPTPRSYAKAIMGPYSSKWQIAMDAKMVSSKSTGTYGVNFFQTFSPTPKMTTLRVLLHVAAQRDYELHSLDFSTAFLQGSLHEAI